MYQLNVAIVGGRFTSDPKTTVVQRNGKDLTVARGRIATNRPGNGDQADFVDCVAFGGNAQYIEKYLKKGSPILVTGALQTGSYQNKEGQTIHTTELICSEVSSVKSGGNLNCNEYVGLGRLTRDPDVRTTDKGTKVARFSFAVPRRRFGNEETKTDFPNVVCFDKTAEFVERYFTKGKAVFIRGRIQTGSYTNKDGVKIYTTDILAQDVRFVMTASAEAGESGEGFDFDYPAATAAPAAGSAPAQPAADPMPAPEQNEPVGDMTGFENIADGIPFPDDDDEELPFS